MTEGVRLVASELVTNAVVHAGEATISVGLYHDDGRLLLVVHDSSGNAPHRRSPTDDDEAGRGLLLVTALADKCGWERTGVGKKVWAEFTVPGHVPEERGSPLQREMWAAVHGGGSG